MQLYLGITSLYQICFFYMLMALGFLLFNLDHDTYIYILYIHTIILDKIDIKYKVFEKRIRVNQN